MGRPSCQDTCAGARGMAALSVVRGMGGGGGVRKGICHVARSASRWPGCLCRPAKTILLLHGAMLTIEDMRAFAAGAS